MTKKLYTNSAICLLGTFFLASLLFTAMASADKDSSLPPSPQRQNGTSKGIVLKTMNAAGYTYFQVESNQGTVWVAIPQSTVTVGKEVSYYDGIVMPDFSSKTLGKTFERIIFSGGLVGSVQESSNAGKTNNNSFMAGPHTVQSTAASGDSTGAMVPHADVKVTKASGANGYTIEEIFAKKEHLNGKKIRVQGKVVKYSPNIMGKNWIHIQDSTGNATLNNTNLVVTTNEQLDITKEVITIEGTAIANRDFGSGYQYVVIIEDARILN